MSDHPDLARAGNFSRVTEKPGDSGPAGLVLRRGGANGLRGTRDRKIFRKQDRAGGRLAEGAARNRQHILPVVRQQQVGSVAKRG